MTDNLREARMIWNSTKAPVIEVDPINLVHLGDDLAMMTDDLGTFLLILWNIETQGDASFGAVNDDLSIVWTDTGADVMGDCDNCGEIVPVHDGDIADTGNPAGDPFLCPDCL